MYYDFPPYRPPSEAGSILIRLTRGCHWNKCAFCDMYKRTKFERKSIIEIKSDIKEAKKIYGNGRKTIFLGDSDVVVLKNLDEILKFIKEVFPKVERITSYSRGKTLAKKKLEFLKKVRNAGLTRIHTGLESGDPITLQNMNKGETPEEMIIGGKKAKEAGFELSEYLLVGSGGKKRWKEHAVESAKVLNQINPDFIRLRTLTVLIGTLLNEKLKTGSFEIVPPLEKLKEVKLFLETLEVENCYLASDHLTNYLYVNNNVIYRGIDGMLPEDYESMLTYLQDSIDFIESTEFEVFDCNKLYENGQLVGL